MNTIHVLHFSKVINKNDFIDIILRNLNRATFKSFAASYQNESNIEAPHFEATDIKYFSLDISHGWIDIFKGAWRLSRIIKAEKIQILHSHHYYESIIAQMACLLAGNCKHIVGRHYHNQFYLTASGFKLWFYLKVESIINALASCIVVPSTAIVSLLEQQRVNSKKIKLIPYAFDFSAIRYNRLSEAEVQQVKLSLGWAGKFVIGNIGRHHNIKGQTYLIKAFSDVHKVIANSRLVFIGDGPIRQQLMDEVNHLGLSDRVEFLGWRKDAHALLNSIDIVVHPTLQEAFPQIMIETMALNKPILITPVSGATDVIIDRINGFLIPFHNSEALVNTITELHKNPNICKSVSEHAGTYVRAHYTKEKIIPKFESLYASLI